MTILMFAGKTKSGKSTAAEAVVSIDPSFRQVAFADIIREDYSNIYQVPMSELKDVKKKEAYRVGLILLATNRRAMDRYFYARGLFTMIDSMPEQENWVIDDLRAIEELEMGLARDAVPHLIYAEDVPRKFRGWEPNPEIDDHYLENEMIMSAATYRELGGTVIYNNTQSLDDVRNRMDMLLRETKKLTKV